MDTYQKIQPHGENHTKRVSIKPSDAFVDEMKQEQASKITPSTVQKTTAQDTITPTQSSLEATSQSHYPPAQAVQPDPSTIYPTPTDKQYSTQPPAATPLAASSTKAPGFFASTPTGLLVIIGMSLIGACLQLFMNTGNTEQVQSSGLIVFSTVIAVGLSIGLLFYSNVCRILFIIFSSLTVFSSMMGIFQLMDIQSNMGTLKTRFENEIQTLKEKPNLNTKDKESISKLEDEMARLDSASGATFAQAYGTLAFSLGYSAFVVIYLIRPSIKDRFSP